VVHVAMTADRVRRVLKAETARRAAKAVATKAAAVGTRAAERRPSSSTRTNQH
jgi:hypothetical protein